MLYALVAVLALGLTVYALLDVLRRPTVPVLPKPLWVLVCLLPVAGPVAWLLAGRSAVTAAPPAAPPRAPDDDEDFLRELRRRAEEQRRRGEEPPSAA